MSDMKYWIIKKEMKVVAKFYGTKATVQKLYSEFECYPVEKDVYGALKVGDEY